MPETKNYMRPDVQNTPFVDYYSEHGISPVAQDISDLKRHFGRRSCLYNKLGLAPALLRGKRIMECGPGSGHNSLYVLSQSPAFYHLVEGNPVGLRETQKRLTEANLNNAVELKFDLSLFENFTTDERYDLVLSEGLLVFQSDPAAIARHLASFVGKGGIFVGTCADSVSYLSDMIRRILAQACADERLPVKDRAVSLAPMFETHFKNLPGMSRPIVDWLLDNAFQPFYGRFFSLEEAVLALENDFVVYQSQPAFAVDFRWYKDMDSPDFSYNEMLKKQYRLNVHNFIDYHSVFHPRAEDENLELLRLCDSLYEIILIFQFEKNNSLLVKGSEVIAAIADNLKKIGQAAVGTVNALHDGAEAVYQTSRRSDFPDCGAFSSFFGRGQQYISFIKN